MKTLKIHFSDFSSDFESKNDFFYKLLSRKYSIVLDPKNPDFLIYSCYGSEFYNYDCPRIFYTAENLRPDFNLCDYAIGFDYMEYGDRYIRFPSFARYEIQFESLVKQVDFSAQDIDDKTAFCNFIYSNACADPVRDRFFYLLSKYKQVDSLGIHLNNVLGRGGDRNSRGWRTSKVEMQQPYKFSIAFENSSALGYTTEKLMHAFIAGTVPIYWGNPEVAKEFDPKSFINCHDYKNWDEVIKRIVELDNDKDQYRTMLNHPCFYGNVIPDALKELTLLDYFTSIFSQAPVEALRRPQHGTTNLYESTMSMAARVVERKSRASRIRQILGRVKRSLLNRQ